MCGIAGVLNTGLSSPVELDVLRRMLGIIRHRGPDEFGIFRDETAALGSARLSIIDLSGGSQPICNEDRTLWIVFNGEVFNYVELRRELEERGHRFSTHTDTEVILHLYEDHGPACLNRLNGQFAIAIWSTAKRELFLARDRVGVRPLFYSVSGGRFVFGSEIKSILSCPGVEAELDPVSIDQIFTFWSTLSPRTAFRNIRELPPAHYLLVRDGSLELARYWALDFTSEPDGARCDAEYREQLEELLIDACRVRLRADVPVGAYLSGGLDSSLTTAMVRKHTSNRLETFSIAFENPGYDESSFQTRMAAFLGTEHRVVYCTHEDIGRVFPEVIWHTETPILRTAPAPMFMLSKLVNDNHLKVVLTGEGADEFLGGYDIFKEIQIRRFWARRPASAWRHALLRKLYPDIAGLGDTSTAYLAAFFRKGLSETADPFYSHTLRWDNTSRTRRFLAEQVVRTPYAGSIPLPPGFDRWTPLGRAQYLEACVFMSQYLLSSQGDRMAMAHSVEGRYPFLDYRVVEFANRLPPRVKLRGLTEKWLLRQIGKSLLPDEIWRRPKRPYRAPVHRSFFPRTPAWVDEVLSEKALRDAGILNPASVGQLLRKVRGGASLSEVEDMGLVGVLSVQLTHHQFVRNFRWSPPSVGERWKTVDLVRRAQ